jgi:DNA-binding GntR family transcriptional regulator
VAIDEATEAGIDRASPIPLYHQLEELLRREIDAGRYPPGSSLPSEGEICNLYGVSRSVVRQTLTNLVHAGLVRTERGRGSFVAERKLQERFVQRATGLYDDLRRMGYQIRTVVVRQELTQLPVPAREALGVDRGIQIDRVRSVDGRILAFIRSFLREDLCPDLVDEDLEDRSLYAHLAERYGLRPRRGRRTVESVLAKGEIAEHLEVAEGEPLLLLRSASTAEDGEPLEFFEAWHRGDRTAFEIEILPGDEGVVSSVVLDDRVSTPAGAASGGPARTAPRDGDVLDAILAARAVAVLRAARYERPAAVASVLVEHGLPVVEFTLTGENALGHGVTGAHTGGFNSGTMGVAILGNHVSTPIPEATRRTLVQHLAWEAERHSLPPLATATYTNPESGAKKVAPNISGHRDWTATQCPGEMLYDVLPSIRQEAAALVGSIDTKAPHISDVEARKVRRRSAVIRWRTSEPASGQIQYWRPGKKRRSDPMDATLQRGHKDRLAGLRPGSDYRFRVLGWDAAGNGSFSSPKLLNTEA